mgnify:CR=1 FL=1
MPFDSWAHAAGADDVLLLVLVVVGGGHSLLVDAHVDLVPLDWIGPQRRYRLRDLS